MNAVLSGGRSRFLLPLVLFLMFSLPALSPASESCSMLGGACRDACAQNEAAEAGAFEDCGAKQECCVARSQAQVRCCIASLEAKDFGPANCMAPRDGACVRGSGVPVPCEGLRMCATPK